MGGLTMQMGTKVYESCENFEALQLEMALTCEANGWCMEDGYDEDGKRYLIINPPYEPSLEELKTAKLAEIKNRYVETVYAPVWFKQTVVDPAGGEATSRYVGYDTDQNSQIDFNSSYKRAQLKGSTLYNIYVNPDDLTEKEFTYHTPEMFDAALLAAGDYQEGVYIKYYGLKAKVEAAETAEELEAIVW